MRLIGLTGGIATGKSTVAEMLNEHGALVVDADRLAREAVAPGTDALQRIRAEFGDGVFDTAGQLDRAALGRVVFADAERRHRLEQITHPAIGELMQRRIAGALAGPAPLVVVDIPLLFENGRESMVEGVLLVFADEATQLHRLMARDGLDAAEARRRVGAQLPIAEKRARATWVIDNGGAVEETRRQVDAWWRGVLPRPVASP